MKSKNNYKKFIFITMAAIFFITGCHKVEQTNPVALFGLHIHTSIGDSQINPYSSLGEPLYQQEYPDSNGRYEYFTQANLYLSNISLHSTTKGWYTIPGSLILQRIESEIYVVGNVPADTYDNVRFTVGLGTTLNNSAAATTAGPDTVLSVASNNEGIMHSGSANGYYFLSLMGFVDTSAAHSNSNPIPFSYQLGGAGDTVQVSPQPASGTNIFTLAPNIPGAQLVHLMVDYGKLLQSFPITAPTNVNSFTTPGSAAPVWNLVPGIIRYECSVPNGNC